jgi:hypothetical protein
VHAGRLAGSCGNGCAGRGVHRWSSTTGATAEDHLARTASILLALLVAQGAWAQPALPARPEPGVSVIDFVKIKGGKTAEALFYYENNWRVYREIMLRKGFIRGFRLLQVKGPPADHDLLLITEYEDEAQFKLAEDRFQAVIRETNPAGPKLLNAIPPAEFRETVSNRTAAILWSAGK